MLIVTTGQWQSAVESYLASLGTLNVEDAVYAAILRTLATQLDRLPPSGTGLELGPTLPPTEAARQLKDELDAALDVAMQARGPEAHAAYRKARERFEQRVDKARELFSDAYTEEAVKAATEEYSDELNRAIAEELEAVNEMIEALDDPERLDAVIDRLLKGSG